MSRVPDPKLIRAGHFNHDNTFDVADCIVGRNPESYLPHASYQLKPWLFTSAAQNFATNDVNRNLCAAFANADGVALGSSIHLR